MNAKGQRFFLIRVTLGIHLVIVFDAARAALVSAPDDTQLHQTLTRVPRRTAILAGAQGLDDRAVNAVWVGVIGLPKIGCAPGRIPCKSLLIQDLTAIQDTTICGVV